MPISSYRLKNYIDVIFDEVSSYFGQTLVEYYLDLRSLDKEPDLEAAIANKGLLIKIHYLNVTFSTHDFKNEELLMCLARSIMLNRFEINC